MWAPLRNENPTERSILIVSADLDLEASRRDFEIDILSAEERQRASRFRFETDRMRFLAARLLLRQILARITGIDAASLVFERTKHGKPFLVNREVFFNVTHSDRLVLFAFSIGHEVGVDVELLEREVEFLDLAERFFCRSEYLKMSSLADSEIREAFFNCWTRKEAFIKAVGEGLSYPLDKFEVTLLPDEPVQFVHIAGSETESGDWTLRSLSPVKGFRGAIAAKGRFDDVVCRNWVSS